MSEDIKFQIKITGEKFSHEQEIDNIQKAKIISFLMLPDSNLVQYNSVAPSSYTSSNQQAEDSNKGISSFPSNITPREYLNENNASTSAQKIAVFVMYLKEVLQESRVSREQIEKMYDEALEPLDKKHFAENIDRAIRNGWLHSPSKDTYFITPTGENAVNNKFGNKTRKINHKKNTTKRQSKNSITTRAEIEALELQPKVDGYTYYWKLKKGEKVLWLLAQAKEKGITDLNSKEISKLAEKINDHIEPRQITSLVATHVKMGHVYPLSADDGKVLRISQPGIEYVKENSGGVA